MERSVTGRIWTVIAIRKTTRFGILVLSTPGEKEGDSYEIELQVSVQAAGLYRLGSKFKEGGLRVDGAFDLKSIPDA